MSERAPVAIIGAGPAGLYAAERLSAAGARVVVFERMPSVGRKFLLAGRGGLNLTHSEPLDRFLSRYGEAESRLRPIIKAFPPDALVAWAEGLAQQTFVGSSGRVFPKTMKASPLLRAWLARLAAQGVELRTRRTWLGWDEAGALRFQRDDGASETFRPSATLLALGGASWPKLGGDGAWTPLLAARGVEVTALKPANVGFDVAWSQPFRSRFAGVALKTIALRFRNHEVRGEAMITGYGIEGGAVYALSALLRDALAAGEPGTLYVDLKPAFSETQITDKLARAKPGDSMSSTLRKALGVEPVAINLLRESGLPNDTARLAALIKAAPVTLIAPRGLDRAISTAGGVAWSALDDTLRLRAIPGTYVAGEMLDWEAPTGGYLLQACFATGAWAAQAVLDRLASS